MKKKKAPQKKKAAKKKVAEPTSERCSRAKRILTGLEALYPDADCALDHRNAFELLVATILSAQSTDANVNKVTPELFASYPDAGAFAEAEPLDIERLIHSTGFFRQKTKSILGASRRIVEVYGGRVPDSMEDLVSLPGVARKTANVILGTWFKKNEGIVVDTHVGRLSERMGLTWSAKNSKDAVRIEEDLRQLIRRDAWTFFGHAMILHGRQICSAKKPDCAGCTVSRQCPSAFEV